jgi:hypothetical protein
MGRHTIRRNAFGRKIIQSLIWALRKTRGHEKIMLSRP